MQQNRASWDDRATAHASSEDYAVQRFVDDPTFLSDVVRFDVPRLGSLGGLDGVHLQCHIGTDTLSLARLGARMTGLDFSGAAIEQARRLAEATGTDLPFVRADVHDAVDVLGANRFDFVFTGIGALCWLPRITPWARVVAGLLRPGGRLFIREGHPMLWAVDETQEGLVVDFPYFETDEPVTSDDPGTYVQTDATFEHNVMHNWNHGLGELVTALLGVGFAVSALAEHDSVPWDALPGRMERLPNGEYRLSERPERLACSFTLQAVLR